jgi:hypothetical protein
MLDVQIMRRKKRMILAEGANLPSFSAMKRLSSALLTMPESTYMHEPFLLS